MSATDSRPNRIASGSGDWGQRLALAREQLFALFFFGAFLFLLYQLYQVFASFLGPIVWALILTLVFYPLYERVLALVGKRPTIAALVMTLLLTAFIALPTASLSSVVTREAVSLVTQLADFVRSGRWNDVLEQLRASRPGHLLDRMNRAGWEIDYGTLAQRAADAVSGKATALARNVAVFLFDFTIMLFTLFFLFRDGERMYRGLRDVIPMEPAYKDAIFHRLYETLSAVMRGMVVTALCQGVLTWLGLWGLAVPYAAFLGVLAGLVSLVPLLGAAAVWIPCTIYLAVVGAPFRAVALLVYGIVVISMVDNILRPLLIGGQTRLPTIFLFFGMLGGVEVYGVLGIFLGPVLLSIVFAFASIYKEQYATAETGSRTPVPPP